MNLKEVKGYEDLNQLVAKKVLRCPGLSSVPYSQDANHAFSLLDIIKNREDVLMVEVAFVASEGDRWGVHITVKAGDGANTISFKHQEVAVAICACAVKFCS